MVVGLLGSAVLLVQAGWVGGLVSLFGVFSRGLIGLRSFRGGMGSIGRSVSGACVCLVWVDVEWWLRRRMRDHHTAFLSMILSVIAAVLFVTLWRRGRVRVSEGVVLVSFASCYVIRPQVTDLALCFCFRP